MTLSFIEYLEQRLHESPPKQKGLRTKRRLIIAAAKILERDGYHAMRLADISSKARLAEGSFYLYFTNKSDIALTVLGELVNDFVPLEIKAPGEDNPFAAIRAANRRWIALCRANAGLIRCVWQLGDEDHRIREMLQRSKRSWYERVAHVSTNGGRSSRRTAAALFAAYLLGGMMDELVRMLIIYPDPRLREVLDQLQADDDMVADAASILWLTIFHPNAKRPRDLSPAAKAVADWIGLDSELPVRSARSTNNGRRT